jgi:hypothetical protein
MPKQPALRNFVHALTIAATKLSAEENNNHDFKKPGR